MLQLNNGTPFAADIALMPNEQGIDTLYLIVKASFNISNKWTLLENQPVPEAEDIYWGEPAQSSLKFASDYHTGKPVSDIIMLGNAYVPNAKSARQLDVSLSVGKVAKTIRVTGNRVWQAGQISQPQAFQSMPMVYEKAFGGQHIVNAQTVSNEPSNPVGTGYSESYSAQEREGQPLPNLENPAQCIHRLNDQPEPACFGFVSAGWKPRVNYVGSYDKHWQENRAPYLPENFDSRFFNMAHKDLIYPGYLSGGEKVHISNMHPAGDLRFSLPVIKLFSEVQINQRIEHLEFNLETLLLQPNQLQLSLVFRASLCCNLQTQKINKITLKRAA